MRRPGNQVPGKKSPVSLVFVDFLTYTCCMKKYIERIKNLNPIDMVRLRLANYQIGMVLLTFITVGYNYNNSNSYATIVYSILGVLFMAEAIKTIKSIKSITQKRPTN